MCQIEINKTRQGYTRKRILKLAGSSFLGGGIMSRPFNKPATTHSEQVLILQKRGMIIGNVSDVEFHLQHLNYYRLRAYWIPFEVDLTTHQFKPDTHFSDVLNLYTFDRELRLMVLDAIERVEVSIRSQWAYQMAHMHGPHSHLDSTLFSDRYWQRNLDQLTKEVQRADEVFIRHLQTNYSESLPPIWAVAEIMSLGSLSRWYGSLKPKRTRRSIASIYGIDEAVLESWLQHLSLVRNICAHHSRLWNREFAITPKLPRQKSKQITTQFVVNSRKLHNTLVILVYLLDVIAPGHLYRERLKDLISGHSIPVNAMGFPQDWETRSVWRQ